ncbi:MAG: hybrid sensor histidine kinase/response regulator [Pseudomonadota bacterium]
MNTQKADRILVVDDNGKNLQFMGSLLSKNGYDVAFALNGSDALNSIPTTDPDLILLDIMMPDMDGYEVCEKIKLDKDFKDIPIIFLTAKNQPDDVVDGFGKGAIDYISKPFHTKELLARIKTHIELKKAREKIETNTNQILSLNALLNRKNQDLSTINKEMEKIVRNRTIALEKANEKLSVLNNEKTDFLQFLSHEMNTPLNFISVTNQLDKDNLSDEAKEIIEMVEAGFTRINDFMKAVLDYFGFAGQTLVIKKQELLVQDIVEIALSRLAHLSAAKNISIMTEFEKGLSVYADKYFLQKTISILIDNAMTYSNENSMVHITTATKNSSPMIRIEDAGKGISPENIKKIFKPFIVQDFDRHESGYGLNLPKAKIMADACGWTLTAQSQGLGMGACFTVLIG